LISASGFLGIQSVWSVRSQMTEEVKKPGVEQSEPEKFDDTLLTDALGNVLPGNVTPLKYEGKPGEEGKEGKGCLTCGTDRAT
jgi:hypothetical protein